ncbi:glutathione S-transferase family protein [Nitrospirillum iridis]|uniref:Glutathione S-transferase n=1 Tax=Nitrospirillum iridis TaxID=765888 RepID=A0A7X0AZJ6_9PROT|nr:glutathione S-transferase N-terminal domain-containing protein [Nitrospirillum iridis]MBB6252998.1 glutathione S-transferase [Nitrospirillum iridis]
MRLIGMPDSPYVRRVGISLVAMGVAFEHEAVSVFRHYDIFAAINPVVKAPTLVLDDGTVLMDSTLILDTLERLVPADKHLMPVDPAAFIRAQRIIGLALVACEKSVQVAYELNLRPADKQHQPWLERVRAQAVTAFDLLEKEVGDGAAWMGGDRPNQADITTAVAWYFTQNMTPGLVDPALHSGLVRLSDRAEALPEFQAVPYA